jgi:hypothetical protein
MAEWGAWLPECFWPIWGAALATATVSYHLRRKDDPNGAAVHHKGEPKAESLKSRP